MATDTMNDPPEPFKSDPSAVEDFDLLRVGKRMPTAIKATIVIEIAIATKP